MADEPTQIIEIKKEKKTLGRPTVMTPEILGKLDEAFLMGCTDLEACLFADIHPDSLYEYQKKNPDYSERKEALKKNPFMKARQTITGDLKTVDTAKWLLENYDGQAKRGGNQTNTQVNVFAGLREKYLKKNTPPVEVEVVTPTQDVTVESNG